MYNESDTRLGQSCVIRMCTCLTRACTNCATALQQMCFNGRTRMGKTTFTGRQYLTRRPKHSLAAPNGNRSRPPITRIVLMCPRGAHRAGKGRHSCARTRGNLHGPGRIVSSAGGTVACRVACVLLASAADSHALDEMSGPFATSVSDRKHFRHSGLLQRQVLIGA